MLDPLDVWTAQIKALPPASDPITGVTNFVQCISLLTNKVQAGPTGSVGIFMMDQPTFIAQLMLPPTGTNSWAITMALAWQTAVMASTITPGTVASPAWTASGVDVLTVPSASATITTVSAGFSLLQSELAGITSYFASGPTNTNDITSNHPKKLAQAFRDAALAFEFLCIGLLLVPPAPPVPLPLPFSAE